MALGDLGRILLPINILIDSCPGILVSRPWPAARTLQDIGEQDKNLLCSRDWNMTIEPMEIRDWSRLDNAYRNHKWRANKFDIFNAPSFITFRTIFSLLIANGTAETAIENTLDGFIAVSKNRTKVIQQRTRGILKCPDTLPEIPGQKSYYGQKLHFYRGFWWFLSYAPQKLLNFGWHT